MTELSAFLNVAPPKRPETLIQIYGQPGSKGVVVVQEEFGVGRKISLTPTTFAVVLALAEKLVQDALLPAWAPRGFLSTADLKQRLSDWNLRQLSPHYATKHIYRARKRLAREVGKVGALDGTTWSRQLLEFDKDFRAYRLSVLPEHVYVHSAGRQRA